MSKHKTLARLTAIADARDEARAIVREAKMTAGANVVAYQGLPAIPLELAERICLGCGAKVIPGLTNHCNH